MRFIIDILSDRGHLKLPYLNAEDWSDALRRLDEMLTVGRAEVGATKVELIRVDNCPHPGPAGAERPACCARCGQDIRPNKRGGWELR